jgi:hypothetical protein
MRKSALTIFYCYLYYLRESFFIRVLVFLAFKISFGSDPKLSNKIFYKDGVELQVLTNADEKKAEEKKEDGKIKKKEQSVLQSKLTKLAIQIGYAGK